MSDLQRTTIYIKPSLYKALKLKSVQMEKTISDLVNESIQYSLAEDALDLDAIQKRKNHPERDFESFVMELKKNHEI